MIFPRLFTCPTLATANFKIGEYNFYETESLYVKCQYVGTMLPNPCMTFSQTFSVNVFQWRIRGECTLTAWNNKA